MSFIAVMTTLNFQHHYGNHSNMTIWCSRNISDDYQCWKQYRNCDFFSGFFD